MSQDQPNTVRAGIFVIVGGVIIILFILVLGQRTHLFAREYSLTATFSNAGGLLSGATVRVAGVSAGNVRSIQIIRGGGGVGAVKVELNLGIGFRDAIREDSVATVRTLGILGDKYVEISLGSDTQPPLPNGGTVKSQEAVDYYEVADEARETFRQANAIAKEIVEVLRQLDKAALVHNLNTAAQSLSQILANAEKGPSLLHSLAYDPDLPKMLDDFSAATKSLRASAEKVQSGKGDLGEIIYGERLTRALADFGDAVASAKAIMKEVETGEGVAHAVIYDKAQRKALDQLSAAAEKLNAVMTEIHEGQGTLGLFIADPGVWESLQRLLSSAQESSVLKFLIERSAKEKKD